MININVELPTSLALAHERIKDLEAQIKNKYIFSNIFESSPIPFLLFTNEGLTASLNSAFTRMCGYTIADIANQQIWREKAYPDTAHRNLVSQKWLQQILESQQSTAVFEPIELTIKCKNDTECTVLACVTALAEPSSNTNLTIFFDITGLKEAKDKVDDLLHSLAASRVTLEQQNAELLLEKEKAFASEERLRLAMQGANDGLWDWDVINDIIYFSPRWKSMLGYSEDEIANNFSAWENLVHPEDLEFSLAKIQSFLDRKIDDYEIEFRMIHKLGHSVYILSRAFALESEDATITRLTGTHEDITARKKVEDELKYQSSHDCLTGLINRRQFENLAQQILDLSTNNTKKHALCYIDLDQFKVVNDSCGHDAGDELLCQLAFQLQKRLRPSDTLARLGGDEFGVLIRDCSLEQAKNITRILQTTIQEYKFMWKNRCFQVGASFGLVEITNTMPSLAELFKKADVACYMAKEHGRNRIHVHFDDDQEISQRQGEMQWVSHIQSALNENRFCLYAQAIEDTNASVGSHYELLIRMIDSEGNILSPAGFLPAAERYNLISHIDRWVVQRAVDLLIEYPKFLKRVNFVSINLSGQSLTDEYFLEFVMTKIRRLNEYGHKICFEITETAAISNLLLADKFISSLKQLGCRFALDDFGSGLSSFAYLKNLSVDYLKIDGAFIKDIISDPIDRAMVKSIHEIGQVMGIKTIAEFVETAAIHKMLSNIGVDYVQGYAIHKPEDFMYILKQTNMHEE